MPHFTVTKVPDPEDETEGASSISLREAENDESWGAGKLWGLFIFFQPVSAVV